MDNLQATDDAARAVQKTPNRVSLADIEARIVEERIFLASNAVESLFATVPHESLKVLTLCLLVLDNGFTVVGKTAPADAANFDAALGAKFAREDAIRQLGPLMGFALRDKLMIEPTATPNPVSGTVLQDRLGAGAPTPQKIGDRAFDQPPRE